MSIADSDKSAGSAVNLAKSVLIFLFHNLGVELPGAIAGLSDDEQVVGQTFSRLELPNSPSLDSRETHSASFHPNSADLFGECLSIALKPGNPIRVYPQRGHLEGWLGAKV